MVTTAEDTLHEGVEAAQRGDAARARKLFRAATAQDPDNETAWLWQAKVADDPVEMADCLLAAWRVNPDNARVRAALPDVLVRAAVAARANRGRANEFLEAAIELDSRHEIAWLWRASLATNPEDSRECLQAVLAINPGNEKAKVGLAQVEKQLAPEWRCPLCDHPAPESQKQCPACGGVLTLLEPEEFDTPQLTNRATVQKRAKALHASAGAGTSAADLFTLGLAYLNLGFGDDGVRVLQVAVRQTGADPSWRLRVARLVQHREEQARKKASAPPPPLVLVVDDSPTVRKLVANTLGTAGYRVIEAESGTAAAEAVRRHGVPAVFVLDVNMPEMDGFTLCKSFRSSPETSKVPVIFLTGKDGFLSKLRGQWAGASEYLTKPFEPARLLKAVGKLARSPARTPPATADGPR